MYYTLSNIKITVDYKLQLHLYLISLGYYMKQAFYVLPRELRL